jgi:nucleoside-diphosphate-sugar epimerase
MALETILGALETILGRVQDFGSVYEAVGKVDGVIHLAAVLGTQETIHCPEIAVETNIRGSLNVFEACARFSKPCVYITVGNHWMQNPYSITKTCAERFAWMFNKERGTRIAVVRALNAYGPGQKSKPVRKIIPTFIEAALAGKPIPIYGDGSQIMDMIWVRDVAEILVRALVMDHGNFSTPFEAGTGKNTSVQVIAELVLDVTGSPAGVEYLPMRPGEPESSVVLGNPKTLKPLEFRRDRLVDLELGILRTVRAARGEK